MAVKNTKTNKAPAVKAVVLNDKNRERVVAMIRRAIATKQAS